MEFNKNYSLKDGNNLFLDIKLDNLFNQKENGVGKVMGVDPGRQ